MSKKEYNDLEMNIVNEAIKFWECLRPLEFTLEDHLKNPTVNCGLHSNHINLALAVAEYLKEARSDKMESDNNIKKFKELIKLKYPNITCYRKLNMYYIVSPTFPGLTIGSGETEEIAWREAMEYLEDVFRAELAKGV